MTRSEHVANLSGFLYATSSFSGALRHYVSRAHEIEVQDASRSVADVITDDGQYECDALSARTVEIDRRRLETGIRSYLIRDENVLVADCVDDIRRYLSFRVMDMIEDIFGDDYRSLAVHQIDYPDPRLNGDSTFFCLRSANLLLVLWFNHRKELYGHQPVQEGNVE